jgi:signal transduction histidine kinase
MPWRSVQRLLAQHQDRILFGGLALLLLQEVAEMLLEDLPVGETILHAGRAALAIGLVTVLAWHWRERSDTLGRLEERVAHLGERLGVLQQREASLTTALEQARIAHEEERRLLAFDIHDCLAQSLVSAKQHLDTFQDRWRDRDPRAEEELGKGLDRLGRAVVETRLVLATLEPATPDGLGLVPAVRALLEEASRQAGWPFELHADLGDQPLPHATSTAVYRIVEEALANATKHARASQVVVELRRWGRQLQVEVRDRGVGFQNGADSAPGVRLGLSSMRERARLVGGVLQVESVPAVGTRIRVTIPLEAHRE